MKTSLYDLPYQSKVCTVKDVQADKFIVAFAKHLKNLDKFEYPKWADYVKTGISKELAPYDPDWLYIRCASVLRHLYLRPDTGVNGFRKLYSSLQRRGTAPGHSKRASGKIIRYILQKFEGLEFVEQSNDKGGRRLTKKGQSELDRIAVELGQKKKLVSLAH